MSLSLVFSSLIQHKQFNYISTAEAKNMKSFFPFFTWGQNFHLEAFLRQVWRRRQKMRQSSLA